MNIEELRRQFRNVEILRFNIVSNYVTGMVNVDDIEEFKKIFFDLRDKLDAFPTNDENILEIAGMKSKMTHYNAEVLEDENILEVAYANSN
jgi:hypothetical protein